MKKERFPIRKLIDDFALTSGMEFTSFGSFERHVKPLNIKAGRKLLVVGSGDKMQELAVVEGEIASGIVKEVCLVNRDGFLDYFFRSEVRRFYPELQMSNFAMDFQKFFEFGQIGFDTAIFIGREGVPALSVEEIATLASGLNPGGRAFITDNVRPKNRLNVKLTVPGCEVKVIPDIPEHPIFNLMDEWQGIEVRKL